ncbi:beta-1,3-galactosyltransferase 5 [Anoplophora glabripennis]|uniref:beta-1,3-galactosyltransferase 5 n=1 Tax=Anoplophora glabripennis TaxID=217634 RepID=UPI00087398FE|nr:beta-1,3-galactosyltransferase 5 [Anoplophora glabripennis]
MCFTRTKYYQALVAVVLLFILIITFSIKNKNQSYISLIEIEEATNSNPRNQNQTFGRIFDIDLKYVLNNGDMCEKDSNILALFIVTSYFANTETRSSMRRIFTREDLKLLNFRRVFLLGEAPADKFVNQKEVEDESKMFGDIVQGNFIEAYRNLTYKHVMGLKWAKDYCSNAKYVIKMDDDIVVNVERVPNLLQSFKLPKSGNFMAGYILKNMFPIREPANKWYVTPEEYDQNTYPLFVSGWFYVTTPNTSAKLVALSKTTKYFWIDDTYITGILARKLKIRHFDISQYFAVHAEYLNCCIQDVRNKHLDCDILVGPNGGNSNLFYDFNLAMNICDLKLCKARTKSINETCVAERKVYFGRGKAVVENYKLH